MSEYTVDVRAKVTPEPAPNVIPFLTPSERQQRESQKLMRTYTRPMPTEPSPAA